MRLSKPTWLLLLLGLAALLGARRGAAQPGWSPDFAAPGPDGAVLTLLPAPDGGAYVGGQFRSIGRTATGALARYDPSEGTFAALGYPGLKTAALALGRGDTLFATDGGNVYRYDGATWTILGRVFSSGSGLPLAALAYADGVLYVGGSFGSIGANDGTDVVSAANLARFDGAHWRTVGAGVSNGIRTSNVNALAFAGGHLYVGGRFTSAGGLSAQHLARFDPAADAFVSMPGVSGRSFSTEVFALHAAPDGTLYAGGAFDAAGSVTSHGIARWTGSDWEALGTSLSLAGDPAIARATAFADYLGALAVAGDFDTAGGQAAPGLALWNEGTDTWTPLGSGPPISTPPAALATVVRIPAPQRTDGPTAPERTQDTFVLLFGGSFSQIGNDDGLSNLAEFTGAHWRPVAEGDGLPETIRRLSATPGADEAVAVVEHSGTPSDVVVYESGTWHRIGRALTGTSHAQVRALAARGVGDVVIGGTFDNLDGNAPAEGRAGPGKNAAPDNVGAPNGLARWNGSGWRALPDAPFASASGRYLLDVQALARAGGDTLFVAATVQSGLSTRTEVLRFDGATWLRLGRPNSTVHGLVARSGRDVVVLGAFSNVLPEGGTAFDASYVARWTASAGWQPLGPGLSGTIIGCGAAETGVWIGRDLYVGGDFTESGTEALGGLARWDGTAWTAAGAITGQTGSECGTRVRALATDGTTLYAGGSFTELDGQPGTAFVGQWTGTTWAALDGGIPPAFNSAPNVFDASVGGGSLWVGGRFQRVGTAGTASSNVARFFGGATPPANRPPVAVDDAATTNEDTSVLVDVHANDSDPDGDPLALTAVSDFVGGSAVIEGSSVRFTPTPDFNGAASFRYMTSDGALTAQSTARITVQPINDAPVAADDAAATDGTPVVIRVLANDTDVDGDALTIAALLDVTGGTAEVVNDTTARVRFTPGAGFSGDASFRYVASDGALTDTARVTIAVRTRPTHAPVAVDDAATTDEDAPVLMRVLANDRDEDGDALHVAATFGATGGTATVQGDTAVVFTPTPDFNGTASFHYVVTDGSLTDTARVTITVRPVNDAPVARDDAAATAYRTPVTIRVLANDTDVDGDALTVAALLDVTGGAATLVRDTTDRVVFTPNAGFSGIASLRYVASDGALTDTARVMVAVADSAGARLLARDDFATTDEDVSVVLNVLQNDLAPAGARLAIAALLDVANGTASLRGDTAVVFTPAPDASGTASFRYIVSDGTDRDTALVTLTVQPVNDPPITRDDAATVDEDTSVSVEVLANDRDVDGDSLRLVATFGTTGGAAQIDGTRVRFVPPRDFNGEASFGYVVSDGALTDTALVTITVRPVNDAPVAADDAAATDEDTPVTVDVRANDADVDGDALTVALLDGPRHGTASVVDGALRYVPGADFAGADSLRYRLSDGALSDTATVRITVRPVNDAPVVLRALADTTVLPGSPAFARTLTGRFSDPEGSPLTFAATSDAPAVANLRVDGATLTVTPGTTTGSARIIVRATDPEGAAAADTFVVTVSARPNRAPVAVDDAATTDEDTPLTIDVLANDSDPDGDALTMAALLGVTGGAAVIEGGRVRFTPTVDASGTVSFGYVVSDGALTDTARVTITVRPVNDAPVAADDDAAATDEDTPVTVDVRANDADVDGDALTITALLEVSGGTAVIEAGQVRFSPTRDFNGAASFRYVASDGALTDTALVTITVRPVNDAPVAADDAAATPFGVPVTVRVLANDTDVDGDALTIAATFGATGGTATVQGDTAVVFTPVPEFSGAARFRYVVRDGLLSDTAAVVVMVGAPGNRPPLAGPDTARVAENVPILIVVLANDRDPDGDALRLVAVTAPSNGGTAVRDGDAVRYRSRAGFTGVETFAYTVSDGVLTTTALVTVEVSGLRFTLTDLGTLGGGFSRALGLNDAGVVVGVALDASGALTGFRFDEDAMTALRVPGARQTQAYAVDATGAVAGFALFPDSTGEAIRFAPDGTATRLGRLGGRTSVAFALAGGQAVGAATDASGTMRAVRFGGAPVDVSPASSPSAVAYGVGDGLVVGLAYGADGTARGFAGGALLPEVPSRAYAAAGGRIVGSVGDGAALRPRAWRGGVSEALSPDGAAGEALAANASGWVVGYAVAAGGAAQALSPAHVAAFVQQRLALGKTGAADSRAVLWSGDVQRDLTALVDGADGWVLEEARAVNDVGQIAGFGTVSGQTRAFLLTPAGNRAPIAASDAIAAPAGAPVDLDLLANDRDPDGDALTLADVEAPTLGAVTRLGGGRVRFTPPAGFVGTATFGYHVRDSQGATAQGTATVTVGDAPRGGVALLPPFPNPATDGARIPFVLDAPATVHLALYSADGRLVATLADGAFDAGTHVALVPTALLAPGLYVVRLRAGGATQVRSLVCAR